MAFWCCGNLFWRTRNNYRSSTIAAFWTHVNNTVSHLNDIQVVLNDKNGVARINKTLKNNNKLSDILKMKASCWLVQNIKSFTSLLTVKLFCKLNALRLATRKRSCRLAKVNVAKTYIVESLQLVLNTRNICKECKCLVNRHVKHVGDRLAVIENLERLAVIALAMADLARNVDVRQEVHLNLDLAVALTSLAAASLDVKRETTS